MGRLEPVGHGVLRCLVDSDAAPASVFLGRAPSTTRPRRSDAGSTIAARHLIGSAGTLVYEARQVDPTFQLPSTRHSRAGPKQTQPMTAGVARDERLDGATN